MIIKLDHVGIKVTDLSRSLKFYQDTLGFTLAARVQLSPEVELAFLKLESQPDIELELVCSNDLVDKVGVVNHLSFEVEDLEGMLKRLEQLGLEIVDREPRVVPGKKIVFFWGPDGEKLELNQRT